MTKKTSFTPTVDQVFRDEARGKIPFRFDETVANAFDDMAARSIPGYAMSLRTAVWLAREHIAPQHTEGVIYDLGASTGALEHALLSCPESTSWRFVAVDKSPEMIARAQARVAAHPRAHTITWRTEDVQDTPIENALLVVSHYCLQFVAPSARSAILDRIFAGLHPGGYLLLSEKTSDEPHEAPYFRSRYEAFKRDQGYTQQEIDNKKHALEGVLIPWSAQQNEEALRDAGFESPVLVTKHWNFATWIAKKPARNEGRPVPNASRAPKEC